MEFQKNWSSLTEKHLPVYFMDDDLVQSFENIMETKRDITRREILILAYMIGANSKEADRLLRAKNFSPLYVKTREDAVWKFALDNRKDLSEIMEKIFPQNVNE